MKKQTYEKSKNITKITPLSGKELHRFRTRAVRRRERKQLSPIWPKVWLPSSSEYLDLVSYLGRGNDDYRGFSPLVSPRQWSLHLPDQSEVRCIIKWSSDGLEVVDALNQSRLLSLPADMPWLTAQSLESSLTENRGFFHLQRRGPRRKTAISTRSWCGSPPESEPLDEGHTLTFSGSLIEVLEGEPSPYTYSSLKWSLSLVIDEGPMESRSLTLQYRVFADADEEFHLDDLKIGIHLSADKDESIFGMGAQLTWLDLKGKVVPSWAQEPGIGRGVQPLTWFMERFFKAGGSDVQSSAPAPVYMTSERQTHALDDYHFALFDFTRPLYRSIEVWRPMTSLKVFGGDDTPRGRLKSLSRLTGVMPSLPTWLDQGAVIGVQGGTERVMEIFKKLKSAGVSISALWLQDWVGKRETSVGEQLWWDWSLDEAHYPDWTQLIEGLAQESVHVMGYINPYLVDTSTRKRLAKGGRSTKTSESLFKFAQRHGYLVMDPDHSHLPLMIKNTSFEAAIVDLSDPVAFGWLKGVIKERMVKIGLKGWMADFGEALPIEVQLHGGSGQELHNRFPELWAQLNREVIDELQGQTDQYLFFNRSGFLQTPQMSQLTWLGDQLTSWKKYDGIYSGLVGLLSSGFSAVTLTHSDTGGYICTDPPRTKLRVPLMSHARSPELLMRWAEMNAFTAILRTHEGNQPNRHHQIYDDEGTLIHFAKMSKLY